MEHPCLHVKILHKGHETVAPKPVLQQPECERKTHATDFVLGQCKDDQPVELRGHGCSGPLKHPRNVIAMSNQ